MFDTRGWVASQWLYFIRQRMFVCFYYFFKPSLCPADPKASSYCRSAAVMWPPPSSLLYEQGKQEKKNLTGINKVSHYYHHQCVIIIIFHQAGVLIHFLGRGRFETQMMKGWAECVKHLSEQLRAWMVSTEIDWLGCKTHWSVVSMSDSVICFTSPRLAETTVILMLSEPLVYTSCYM